jgi:hypothetical protein
MMVTVTMREGEEMKIVPLEKIRKLRLEETKRCDATALRVTQWHSGLLSGTQGYSGLLSGTQGYSGLLSGTQGYSVVLRVARFFMAQQVQTQIPSQHKQGDQIGKFSPMGWQFTDSSFSENYTTFW